jgi:dipeptidyl aminopeptidase/acylaminoacyl peptidase
LSYIDEDKIVVWGREYGGFLTFSLLASDPLVNCAIAVSPITNWRNYGIKYYS